MFLTIHYFWVVKYTESIKKTFRLYRNSSMVFRVCLKSDVERAVTSDRTRFNRAVKDWTDDKKAGLTILLAAYLSDNPEKLASLIWLPTSLIVRALPKRSLLSNLQSPAISVLRT